jgi:predicted DNA binding protein
VRSASEAIVKHTCEDAVRPISEAIVRRASEAVVRHTSEDAVRPISEAVVRHTPEAVVRRASEAIVRHTSEDAVRPISEAVVRHAYEAHFSSQYSGATAADLTDSQQHLLRVCTGVPSTLIEGCLVLQVNSGHYAFQSSWFTSIPTRYS